MHTSSQESPEGQQPIGLAVLGSTGSIGTQALDVVRLFPNRFRVVTLTAHQQLDLLIRQAIEFKPECVVVAGPDGVDAVVRALQGTGIRVLAGVEGLCEAASQPEVDTVLAAVVGFAGLEPVLSALRARKRIALANKETLVVAGELVMKERLRSGSELIPVDSEHSAIFQCLQGESGRRIEKLILTASGGPFRTRNQDTFAAITRDEALRHPNWSMGAKITIDSATMMNKGLEMIEAHWLFDVPAPSIDVLIHPQSIVHSMVGFVDGSIKAQLGVPDMKVPIQYALTYPDRWPAPHARIQWDALQRLDFEPPDPIRFPAVSLAYDALALGGTAPAVLNAANERAVALFLEERIRYIDIPLLVEAALERLGSASTPTLEALHESDRLARLFVEEHSRLQVI